MPDGTRPNAYYPKRLHGAMEDIADERGVELDEVYHTAAKLVITLDPVINDYQPGGGDLLDAYLASCRGDADTAAELFEILHDRGEDDG